jgi:hypothetical protein
MKAVRSIVSLFLIGIFGGTALRAADSLQTAQKISPFFRQILSGHIVSGRKVGTSKLSAGPIIQSSGDTLYPVIIRTTDPQTLRNAGIQIHSVCKNFVTAHVTTAQVQRLSELSAVTSIREGRKRHPNNDIAAGLVGARDVQNGAVNNTKYNGEGVLVCDIDTGIDWKHPDFRNPDDTTQSRIVAVWDQTLTAGSSDKKVKGYGVLYTQAQINDELDGSPANFVRTSDNEGHGTHVTGTLAGNGASMKPTYKYAGMAPKADILMVKTDFDDSSIIDGIEWADSIAAALGKPLVINLSLGSEMSAHDGTDDDELAIDEVSAKAGRVVVVAAGNAGKDYCHVSGTIAANDSATITFTVPSYSANSGTENDYVYIDAWMSDNSNVTGYIQSPNGLTLTTTAENYSYNMSSDGLIYTENYTSSNNNNREIFAEIYDYNAAQPPKKGAWIMRLYNKTSSAVPYNTWFESSLGTSESTVSVTNGDNQYVVTTPGNSTSAITATAYTSRWYWKSIDGSTYASSAYTNSTDNIALFSGRGPRVDNVQKPDIAAPGFWLVSVFPNSTLSSASYAAYLTPDGKHWTMAGTSMAAPCVAGCCALLLQYNSNLTAAQIKSAVTSTATADTHTGNLLPDYSWGYGKLDVSKALRLLASVSTAPERTLLAYDEWTSSTTINSWFANSTEKYAVRMTPSYNGTLTGMFFHPSSFLKFSGAPSVEIWTDKSGLPGTRMAGPFAIDTSGILASSWNYCDLSTDTINISNGTNYHVVLYDSAGSTDTLSLMYDAASIDGRTSKYSGGTWTQNTNGDVRIRAVLTAVKTSVAATISSFAGASGSGGTLLQWTSSSEKDVSAYRVQSVPPGASAWTTLGTVPGNGTSSSSRSYSFTDTTASAGGTYSYRLAIVDTLGFAVYSSAVQVNTAVFAVLSSFTATADTAKVALRWTSSAETNVFSYQIQSMPDGSSTWTTVGSVAGNGTSSSSHNYSFDDTTVSADGTYSYRLAEIGALNLTAYSSTIQVHYGLPTQFSVYQNFPNPCSSVTTIRYDIAEANRTTIRVYDILGRIIKTLIDGIQDRKTYEIPLNVSKFSSGVYFYKVTSGNNNAVKKIIVLH